jgi:hypothetical protein
MTWREKGGGKRMIKGEKGKNVVVGCGWDKSTERGAGVVREDKRWKNR